MSAKKKFGSPPSGKKAAKFSDPIQDDTNNGVITGKSLAAKIAELSNPSPRGIAIFYSIIINEQLLIILYCDRIHLFLN
jgi:hypothetical protein